MQNADKMHLFCCHSQQPDSCKSCDFSFISILKIPQNCNGDVSEKVMSVCSGKKLLCAAGIQKNVWFGKKGEKIEHRHTHTSGGTCVIKSLSFTQYFD